MLPISTPLEPREPNDMSSNGKIVVINGFPGIGKLTVLRRVRETLPSHNTRLIDNHLLIDPVVALFPDRDEDHHELRRKLREALFAAVRQLSERGVSIFITACLAKGNTNDAAALQEHLAMVHDINIPLYWINATCDQSAWEPRLQSTDRIRGSKTKLTDVVVARELVQKNELIEPRAEGCNMANVTSKSLDLSDTVEVSAQRLIAAVTEKWVRP